MAHSHGTSSNGSQELGLNPVELVRLVVGNVHLWIIPAVVCAILAAGYSLFASREWKATQALIVRPEAASVSEERVGKFADLSEMKTLQETILELVKSPSVVQATLAEVGPPANYRRPEQWPTALDVDDFRQHVDMRPPGGAEFGKTEVFYLTVLDTDRDRAGKLVAALYGQLERRMQQLRDDRAQSMRAELEHTVAMADKDLSDKTGQLASFEARIGADLAELRNLNANNSGQSEVSQELQSIELERRVNEAARRENVRLLALLETAQKDAQQLIATPSSLLRSQAAVSRLKDALVDAQLHTAGLLGSRSEDHPYVVASRESEASIRRQLQEEVAVAIEGLQVDIELNVDRDANLTGKWQAARDRLARLAEARAEYANLVSSVENHTKLVEAARKNLADARARQAGALSASVISRIDGVEAGLRPVGLGRTTITAAGGIGGLILGFGLVFLFASPAKPQADVRRDTRHAVTQDRGNHFTPNNNNFVVPDSNVNNELIGKEAVEDERGFGLFRGMTLEEAIRSIEKRYPQRTK